VIWKGKPLTSGKKGSWAHGTGSHVIWKEKPLTSGKKGSWAQGGLKPRRKRGLKVQSPTGATGVIPGLSKIKIKIKFKKKTPCWENKNNLMPDFLGFDKRNSLGECSF